MINQITANDLRHMEGKEGIIFQGCGGDPQEWLDGINDMLTEEGILRDGSRFKDISVFEHDGLTNILFPFEGVKLNMGKLSMWRLQTNEQFGGTWLSDYVPNRLGGFEQKREQEVSKPDCALIGSDGNIYSLIGLASRTLRRCGMDDKAAEMRERITGGDCGSYYEALNIIGEYVNITDSEAPEQGMEMGGMQ